jgi:pilus assembly protein CpaF
VSLLRRIESARPASEPGQMPPPGNLPVVTGPSAPVPPSGALSDGPRKLAHVPLRENFRDAKFRIQQRVISDLDPKLDLTNQIEVRREIEDTFARALD